MSFNKKVLFSILCTACFTLVACGEDKSETEPKTVAPEVQKEHVFSTQQQALEKAKAVEQQIHDAAEKRQEAMNEQLH